MPANISDSTPLPTGPKVRFDVPDGGRDGEVQIARASIMLRAYPTVSCVGGRRQPEGIKTDLLDVRLESETDAPPLPFSAFLLPLLLFLLFSLGGPAISFFPVIAFW